jgi:hypothetical protein
MSSTGYLQIERGAHRRSTFQVNIELYRENTLPAKAIGDLKKIIALSALYHKQCLTTGFDIKRPKSYTACKSEARVKLFLVRLENCKKCQSDKKI